MIKQPKRSLVIDISNLLFRIAAVQKHQNPFAKDADMNDIVGLCMHISFHSILKYYNKYKPDFVVFAFEGMNNWRKTYTATSKTRLPYKGNRVVDPEMKHFYELITSFYDVIKAHTSICCLRVPTMEADDVIAGYCQLYANDDHEIVIISGDKDFIQLLSLPGVSLVNPDTGKLRNQPGDKNYQPDIDYWLFEKCVRGDIGDYVPSAFPRVRATRIKKAFTDKYENINFMNERWTDENNVEHRVGDLFEQNKILLSLFDQPLNQREILYVGIDEQVKDLGSYSHFHFLRFLESYKLNALYNDAMKFANLFANNQRFLKNELTSKSTTETNQNEIVATTNKLLNFD